MAYKGVKCGGVGYCSIQSDEGHGVLENKYSVHMVYGGRSIKGGRMIDG